MSGEDPIASWAAEARQTVLRDELAAIRDQPDADARRAQLMSEADPFHYPSEWTNPHLRYIRMAGGYLRRDKFESEDTDSQLFVRDWRIDSNARAALRWVDSSPYGYSAPPGYARSGPGHLPVSLALRYLREAGAW